MFSPSLRYELDSAIDDCLGLSSEDNRPTRLHGPICEWNVSQVTDMSLLFAKRETFNYGLYYWDVSRVTDMSGMFANAQAFDQDLSEWDVSRVIDMQYMFSYAYVFNQDLSQWDVSCVTDMAAMFGEAKSFNQDLSPWDVSRVTNMNWMFAGANSFQQTLCGAAWVKSNASKIDMFLYSSGFISDAACGAWNTMWHLNAHLPIRPLDESHFY